MHIFRRVRTYLIIIIFSVAIAYLATAYFTQQIIHHLDERIHASLVSEAVQLQSHFKTFNSKMTLHYQKIRSQKVGKIRKEINNLDRFDIYQAVTALAEASAFATNQDIWPVFDTILYFTKSGIAISPTTMYTLNSLATHRTGMSEETLSRTLSGIQHSDSDVHLLQAHGSFRNNYIYTKNFTIRGSIDIIIGMTFIDSSVFKFNSLFDGFTYLAFKDGKKLVGEPSASLSQLPGFTQLKGANGTYLFAYNTDLPPDPCASFRVSGSMLQFRTES